MTMAAIASGPTNDFARKSESATNANRANNRIAARGFMAVSNEPSQRENYGGSEYRVADDFESVAQGHHVRPRWNGCAATAGEQQDHRAADEYEQAPFYGEPIRGRQVWVRRVCRKA